MQYRLEVFTSVMESSRVARPWRVKVERKCGTGRFLSFVTQMLVEVKMVTPPSGSTEDLTPPPIALSPSDVLPNELWHRLSPAISSISDIFSSVTAPSAPQQAECRFRLSCWITVQRFRIIPFTLGLDLHLPSGAVVLWSSCGFRAKTPRPPTGSLALLL